MKRPRGPILRLGIAVALSGGVCILLALIAAVLTWPRLLVPLLGLGRAQPLAAALPLDPDPLTLPDGPLQPIDHVQFVLPPHVREPTVLSVSDPGAVALYGEAATPGVTDYLLVLDDVAVNRLASRWLFADGAPRGAYRDLWIDLQPGSLLLFADVNLRVRWQPAGLLLVHEGSRLTPTCVILGDLAYNLPDRGLALGRATTVAARVSRVLDDLVITGPLPGEAHIAAVRFHEDRVEIHAQATYPAPPPPDTGWQPLEPGIELRQLDVASRVGTERATIVRVDPALVRFRVRYEPANPRRLSRWAAESGALLAVNAGYFTPENEAIGIVVSEGQRWGTSLGSFAGMLAVTSDQVASVRWLTAWPYDPAEPLVEAVQSFPVVVKPGGQMGFPANTDEGLPERRTVIAQDGAGRIVILVTPAGFLSLHELAVFLSESDMQLDTALNLDGGGSTGLWLSAGGREVTIDSVTPLPVVILVERR